MYVEAFFKLEKNFNSRCVRLVRLFTDKLKMSRLFTGVSPLALAACGEGNGASDIKSYDSTGAFIDLLEEESNDSFSSANQLRSNKFMGNISNRSDQDYFYFIAETGNTIKIDYESSQSWNDSSVTVYDDNGRILAAKDIAYEGDVTVNVPASGEIFISVSSENDRSFYYMEHQIIDVRFEVEPNSSLESASRLLLNVDTGGQNYSAADEDIFFFYSSQYSYSLNFKSDEAWNYSTVTIVDSNNNFVYERTISNQNEFTFATIPGQKYYVIVASETDTSDYILRLTTSEFKPIGMILVDNKEDFSNLQSLTQHQFYAYELDYDDPDDFRFVSNSDDQNFTLSFKDSSGHTLFSEYVEDQVSYSDQFLHKTGIESVLITANLHTQDFTIDGAYLL